MKEFSLQVSDIPKDAEDAILFLDYNGNMVELFREEKKIADQFSLGNSWEISLKRFPNSTKFNLRLFALAENAQIYIENKPKFHNGFACELKEAKIITEYEVRFNKLSS